jgi:hypothetical protein
MHGTPPTSASEAGSPAAGRLRSVARLVRHKPLLAAVVVMLVLAAAGTTYAAFTSVADNSNNSVSAAPDFAAPTANRTIVERTAGGSAGHIRQGSTYYVYADVTDSGNPSSGTASVTANIDAVTAGASAAPMSTAGGPWTVSGQTYNYRTASLTADNPLAEGGKSYSLDLADSAGNSRTQTGFSVTIDNTHPVVSSAVVQKSTGGSGGFLRQGASYFVYANPSDAAGVASITANTSTFDTGVTAAAVTTTGGPWTVDGVVYAYRSAALTANGTVTEGSKAVSFTTTDGLTNTGTRTGFSVTFDNTAPAGSNIQTTNNAGGVAGRAELDDTITFTYTDQMDPSTILAGWDGTATNVVVRLNNRSSGIGDDLAVYNSANTTKLALGPGGTSIVVDLIDRNFVPVNRTFGATGIPSTMQQSGTAITVTLGTASGGTTTAGAAGSVRWTPGAAATDRAGNASSTTLVTESGAVDLDF